MKPKALRLAFDLDFWPQWAGSEAAAELRRLHAENERLRSDLATLRAENYNTQSLLAGAEAECDALRRHIKLLQSKVDAEKSCACAYDNPDEVCLPHSPLVKEARAECDALRADAERYRYLRECARATSEHWGGRWSLVTDGPAPKNAMPASIDTAIDEARAALKEPK